jgi:methionyl-tRNA formyltransferase
MPKRINVNYKKDERIWYNYHPAPLPKYKGIRNYVDAIKDDAEEFGVTLHKMNMEFDEGEIIGVKKFKLISKPINTDELGTITHYYLFQLFKETIGELK